MKKYVSFILLGLALPPLSTAGDWLQFRGPDASSVAVGDATGLPTTLSIQDNVAWEMMLPGKGLSSPVVVGDKVFITCSSGPDQKRLHVICFHSADGKKV